MQAGNFIHIEDVVNAMMLALNSGKAASKTFNAAGIKPQHRKARRRGDIKHSHADIKEAKANLGYETKIRLKDDYQPCWAAGNMAEPLIHLGVPFAVFTALGVKPKRASLLSLLALTPDPDVLFHVHRSARRYSQQKEP